MASDYLTGVVISLGSLLRSTKVQITRAREESDSMALHDLNAAHSSLERTINDLHMIQAGLR